ncbi:MAG: TROVE domain-containing protein [Baekduia sp.]
MSTSYLQGHGTRQTPPKEKIPGRTDMVENHEGGFVFAVPSLERLRRFLILGSEGGSYYVGERELTTENVECIHAAIAEHGVEAVEVIVDISHRGRAPKNTPAVFALAVAASWGTLPSTTPAADSPERAAWEAVTAPIIEIREAAYEALPKVCRVSTDLFHFCTFVEQHRGWGRGVARAVAKWYSDRPADRVAHQAIKYRQRDGWTHRDVLRLTHPAAPSQSYRMLYDWICGRQPTEEVKAQLAQGMGVGAGGHMLPKDDDLRIIEGYERVQRAPNAKTAAALIRDYALPREALPTELLKSPEVWEALLYSGGKYGMPIGALVRNLPTMTRIGLLAPGSAAVGKVTEMLTAKELLNHGRIHPLGVLNAMHVYASGRSVQGSSEWAPVAGVVDALDAAFYLAFESIPQTGLRYLLGVDVSGSMDGQKTGIGGRSFHFPNVTGMPSTSPREAAMAMAMVALKSGDTCELTAFSAAAAHGYSHYRSLPEVIPGLSVLPFSPRQRLDDIVRATQDIFPGGTDGSLPMLYATKMARQVDVFVLYTDSENWAGRIHPVQALQQYREASGIPAKLICVNMVANAVTIADPEDSGTLDIVGFDAAAPTVMADFAVGWHGVA